MRGDALRILAAGVGFDAWRVLRAHQAGGAFADQGFDVDAVDEVDRIEDVAFGFGHLIAVGIAHQAVDIDLAERHLAHELDAQHDHAGHPEEDDVEAGDQHAGRVEGRELRRLVRPAQG